MKIETIKMENSPEEYDNLYRCRFVTAGERAFNYNAMIGCCVDGFNDDVWPDWNPFAPKPIGDRSVWVGYDPNGEAVTVTLPDWSSSFRQRYRAASSASLNASSFAGWSLRNRQRPFRG